MHVLEALEPRRLLSNAGDIDPSFGTNGTVPLPQLFPPPIGGFNGHNPLIAAAGNDHFLIFTATGLEEVDDTGSPVAAFGQGGISDQHFEPLGVLVQPDGKILFWGFPENGNNGVLTRLNADGSVDTSFGHQGLIDDANDLNADVIHNIALQSDGKIVVLTQSLSEPVNQVVRRLNADGTLDTSFHDFSFQSGYTSMGFVCQSNDKLVIGGQFKVGDQDEGIIRLNADGTQDLTFGSGGFVSQDEAGPTQDMALIPGGADAFVAVDANGTVRKFSANGVHDTSFHTADGNGVAETDLVVESTLHILAAPGGKWLVYSENGMTRLNADGSRDQSFGRLFADGLSPEFDGAAFDSDGDILLTSGEPALGPQVSPIFQPGLFRLFGAAGGSAPSPIDLANSTLTITGTNGDDEITLRTAPVSSSVAGQPQAVLAGIAGQLGRLFDPADVQHVTVLAEGGNDRVQIGINVAASVSGGDGNDTLYGGDGNDSLSGNAGRDSLAGGLGNDRLAGNGGKDRIDGGAGDDFLLGGAGNDTMGGGIGNDLLEGGAGDDLMGSQFNGGIDTFAGGAGDDLFFSSDGHPESIFGDAGNDTASADSSDILNGVENVSQP